MRRVASTIIGLLAWVFVVGQEKTFPGVTFAADGPSVYISVKQLCFAVGLQFRAEGKKFFVEDKPVEIKRTLFDGTRLIAVRALEPLGFVISIDPVSEYAILTYQDREFAVSVGEKRIEVNKKSQLLRAFQGDLLVAETRVSTGRSGFTTPSGSFTAGPEKSRMRVSRKYENAPMPYSVQIHGGYFMHGSGSVPRYPASHGCVRLPMWGGNAAKWLFSWTDLGTPIRIGNEWQTPLEGPETIPVDPPKAKVKRRQ